jgi:hypothetical protein
MENLNETVLDAIEPGLTSRLVSRRAAIRGGASMGGKLAAGLAMGSVPVALAAVARDLSAQTQADIVDALQFAFILENLENEFYRAVLGISAVAAQNELFAFVRGQMTGEERDAFRQIQKHEQQHVDHLRATLPAFGAAPPMLSASDFDFTGGNGRTGSAGPYAQVTRNFEFILLTAQLLEDTGVRAYKGQLGRFLVPGNPAADAVLEDALRIHSVEARHASKIRRLRRARDLGNSALRFSGYVRGAESTAAGSGNLTNLPTEVVAALNQAGGGGSGPVSYPEGNTRHVVFNGTSEVAIDVASLPNLEMLGPSAARAGALTQAFDEGLTKAEVLTIIRGFIRDDAARGLP